MRFCGKKIALPLVHGDPDTWARALAFEGHDPDVHRAYEKILTEPHRPQVFFDIGASYGLHSLKFLSEGVRTISFEPNPAGHAYFDRACRENGFHGEMLPLAVSDVMGTCELRFPEGKAYLGSIVPEVWDRSRASLRTLIVQRVTLDGFVAERNVVPDLIKIDTEGSELPVLMGGSHLLATRRPVIVFESWPGPGRSEVFDRLASHGYTIRSLSVPGGGDPMEDRSLLSIPSSNFIATAR